MTHTSPQHAPASAAATPTLRIIRNVKLYRRGANVMALLIEEPHGVHTVEFKSGKSVSHRKTVDRALAQLPGAVPAYDMRYGWEIA